MDAAHEAAAQKFVNWATSRDYIKLVASDGGWRLVPQGTRKSTYANPWFQRLVPWAKDELEAIRTADPKNATLPKSPYTGVQFVANPEFQSIGDEVGKYLGEALTGKLSVGEALAVSQYSTKRQMQLGAHLQSVKPR